MSPRRVFLMGLVALLLIQPFAATAESRTVGQTYFGTDQYVEYQAGDLPVIISAPHGGRERPETIPTRTSGVVKADTNTQELARAVAVAIHVLTGHRPHLVICRLHREKVDCNRAIDEGAGATPAARTAWQEYHGFMQEAVGAAQAKAGKSFLVDLHGHAHPVPRLEFGYMHDAELYGQGEAALNAPGVAQAGSLRAVAAVSKLPYSELISGPQSFGALLEERGFIGTPSRSVPAPPLPYFNGGYTTRRYCGGPGPGAGLQIETHYRGLRDNPESRQQFGRALAEVLEIFLRDQFALELPRAEAAAAR